MKEGQRSRPISFSDHSSQTMGPDSKPLKTLKNLNPESLNPDPLHPLNPLNPRKSHKP